MTKLSIDTKYIIHRHKCSILIRENLPKADILIIIIRLLLNILPHDVLRYDLFHMFVDTVVYLILGQFEECFVVLGVFGAVGGVFCHVVVQDVHQA